MAEHERRRLQFMRRMSHLSQGLEQCGLVVPVRPQGAFYVYADVSSSGLTASEFSQRLLDDFHVAATPGADFGSVDTERYVRFACTVDLPVLDEVIRRVGVAVRRYRGD